MTGIQGYTFLKPTEVQLLTGPRAGEYVKVAQHQTLSLDEVHEWPQRAVDHMQGSGIMVPSAASPTDAQELAAAGMGVEAVRDGVSDVPVSFGPTGERLSDPAESADDVVAADEAAADEPAADSPTEFPHPLGDNTFLLSDGTEVSGRAKAVKAQAALEA